MERGTASALIPHWSSIISHFSSSIIRDFAKTRLLQLALLLWVLYGECMARMISTTVRLEEEDVRALRKARSAGHSASELIRKGLRIVASRYYSGRRPPSTRLFESTDNKLGDESELFRDLET